MTEQEPKLIANEELKRLCEEFARISNKLKRVYENPDYVLTDDFGKIYDQDVPDDIFKYVNKEIIEIDASIGHLRQEPLTIDKPIIVNGHSISFVDGYWEIETCFTPDRVSRANLTKRPLYMKWDQQEPNAWYCTNTPWRTVMWLEQLKQALKGLRKERESYD